MHATKACNHLGVSLVNVTVYPSPDFVISEIGEGGYAVSGDWFQIYIDPTRSEEELGRIINTEIPLTVYHELNHVARWNSVGYGSTLPEAMVTEGLASFFAAENWKKASSPWSKYSKAEIAGLIKIFQNRDKKSDNTYDHASWFYGAGSLPKWAGYKLGYYVIGLVRANNSTVGWKKLITLNAEEIIKLSKITL